MTQSATIASTAAQWLFILAVAALSLSFMWEMARNLWTNWGTSNFWVSSLVAALVGMLTWWLIGLVAYLSSPRNAANVSDASQPKTVNQSVTAPVGSTVNQVGGDLTINQGGLSEADRDMIRGLVKKKSVAGMAEFAKKYPLGYLIFGLSADGRPVTYQGQLRDVLIDVNWSNLVVIYDGQTIRIGTPYILLRFTSGESLEMYNNLEHFPFAENQPMQSAFTSRVFYELIDAKERIFLVGFK